MVQGERARGAGVGARQGDSWTGLSFGNSLEALSDATEDICAQGQVRGGAEHIASCCC
jgi:hypothetical protein